MNESRSINGFWVGGTLVAVVLSALPAMAFEGRIRATVTRGGETETFLYAVGTNEMSIARGESNHPYACQRYQLARRGETMEIWATDQLLPFQVWRQNQPPLFGPRLVEEHWEDLLRSKKSFPLLAILRFGPPPAPPGSAPAALGPERSRFEVKSVTPKKIGDKAGMLFQPSSDYQKIQPLPF